VEIATVVVLLLTGALFTFLFVQTAKTDGLQVALEVGSRVLLLLVTVLGVVFLIHTYK
jgi:hypothetical protein